MKISIFIIIVSLMTFGVTNISVADNNSTWEALPENMQSLLGNYRQQWSQLSTAQREQLVTLGKRWIALPAPQQTLLWQRYQRWQQMSSQNRQDIQQAYQRFKTLPEQERQRLMRSHDDYKRMDPARQQEMMQRFKDFQQRSGKHKSSPGNMMSPASGSNGEGGGNMNMGPGMMQH